MGLVNDLDCVEHLVPGVEQKVMLFRELSKEFDVTDKTIMARGCDYCLLDSK